MIFLNDNLCLGGFNQMPDFLDYLYKISNFKLCRPIVFFSSNKEPRKEENGLNKVAA